ncbi:MAG: DNA repair protein RecO [Bacteroidota bacterium]
MLHKTQGIILHNVKFADKKVISKIYTKQFGLISAIIHFGNSPKSKIKSGIIQSLTQIEFELSLKENKDIQTLTDIKSLYVYTDLQLNFNKLCIAQFLNEILYKSLKEQYPNDDLYFLICNTYQWLDTAQDKYLDTHIYFLFELSKHLGFYPTNNLDFQKPYFDTLEGKFNSVSKNFPYGFDKEQSILFASLFNYSLTQPKSISRSERLAILDCLIHYYKIQLPNLNEIKSYQVIQEMVNLI